MRPFAVLFFIGFFGAAAAQAQDKPPTPIHWAAEVQGQQHSFQSGQKVNLALTAQMDQGWHIYAFPQHPGSPVIPTEITVPDGQPLGFSGDIEPPKAESRMDPTVGKETDLYSNSVNFILPLRVSKKAHSGKQDLEVDVRYQACNDRMCLPPRTDKVEASVEIASRH